ncbi:CD63 antigen [Paroedura picta]|uniref:CD63 antigen n=1 Tax=Paroedura picta TaxID=143630 RepID=UPI0040564C84
MGVEGGLKCVRFLVFFFNFVFWLCGIALIALAVFVQKQLNNTITISDLSASGVPIVILIVGVIIFFIAFFGCCGAWKENYCMVTTFAVLLTLIFLVEIAAAIAGYIFRNEITPAVDKYIREDMRQYRTNGTFKNDLDNLQKEFACCGAANFTDWFNVPGFNRTVPPSCCKSNTTDCTRNPTSENTNEVGCVSKIESWLKKHIVIVAGVALGIAFFELLGIIFACCLMKGIRSGYEVM